MRKRHGQERKAKNRSTISNIEAQYVYLGDIKMEYNPNNPNLKVAEKSHGKILILASLKLVWACQKILTFS